MLKPHQKLVVCPFNPEHTVVEDRLQRHVLKCMKNYPNHVKCPYNAIHCFLNKNALEEHILQCPNGAIALKNWDNNKLYTNDAPIHIDVPKNSQDEDWEAEYR